MANNTTMKVSLNFSANINDAKKNIQNLQNSLHQLQAKPLDIGGNSQSLVQSKKAAYELYNILSKTINLDTGKLDLSKFSQQLKKNSTDLKYYKDQLQQMGPEGQRAFMQLAQSIATADAGTIRLNKKLNDFLSTLAKTAKWQISSNIFTGFERVLSNAYRYAQDLNESLNEIRIVSGQNTDQMAKFAKEANKAAKALSTSTVDYTNAALIYYQQGLNDQEIAERTEVTIKMANAAGQSAETVSDQMTAVWNNFYDGSKSLEYYADVMTALGAATASSTDEISDGLEKFAATAETVGLSYEYATSALATVTAETRQSADVVGTAFRTLFTRIQGLQLGETDEDGTTLNKYSEALNAVGVDIKTTSGELKSMDQILAELGDRWGKLSKDTQVALAQTVGGARQYTTLISLMDNWGKFQENLEVANTAEGTLQQQADIYAESWEAASERVGAAAEEIYSKLLNDEFFIDVLNGFEKVLSGLSNFIDGMGGMKGILLLISSIFTRIYAKEVPTMISNLTGAFGIATGQAKKQADLKQQELDNLLKVIQADKESNQVLKTKAKTLELVNKMTKELRQNYSLMSKEEIAEAEARIANVQATGDILMQEAAQIEQEKEIAQSSFQNLLDLNPNKNVLGQYYDESTNQLDINKIFEKLEEDETKVKDIKAKLKNRDDIFKQIKSGDSRSESGKKEVQKTKDNILNFFKDDKYFDRVPADLLTNLEKELNSTNNKEKLSDIFSRYLSSVQIDKDLYQENLEKNQDLLLESMFPGDAETQKKAKEYLNQYRQALDQQEEHAKKHTKNMEVLSAYGNNISHNFGGMSEAMSIYASGVMQLSFLVSSLTGIFRVWNDETLTTQEKLTSLLGLIPSVLTSTIGLLSKENVQRTANLALILAQKTGLKDYQREALKAAAANGVLATAQSGVATTAWAMLVPIGLFTIKLMLIVGAIALVVVGIKSLIDAQRKEEIEAENAAKTAETLSNKYKQVKQDVDDLTNSLNNLGEKQDSLKGLIKGTEEYNKAVNDVNDSILALIEKYPQLASIFDYNSEGILTADPKDLKEFYKEQAEQAEEVRRQSLRASENKIRQQLDVDLEKIYSKNGGVFTGFKERKLDETELQKIEYEQYDTTLQDAIDNSFQNVYTNGSITYYKKGENDYYAQEARTSEEYVSFEEFSKDIEDLASGVKNLETISEEQRAVYLEGLRVYTEEMRASRLFTKELIKSQLKNSDNDKYNNLDEKDKDRVTTLLSVKEDELEETYKNEYSNKTTRELADLYFTEKKGYSTDRTRKNWFWGKKAIGFTKGSEEGETYTKEELISLLAKESAEKESLKFVDEYIDNLRVVQGRANSYAIENGLNNEDLSNLASDLYAGDLKALEIITPELHEILKDNINNVLTKDELDIAAQAAGYETGEAYTSAINAVLDNYDPETALMKKAAQEESKYQLSLQSQAETLEISKESLEGYIETLMAQNAQLAENKELALQVAVSNIKFTRGVKNLKSALEDDIEVLTEWNEGAYETYEAASKVQQALEQMFGVKVSSNFVYEHLEKIKKAAEGDIEAIEELGILASKDFVANLIITDTAKNQLNNLIDELSSKDIEVGLSCDTSSAINELNKLLETGDVTKEELESAFNSIGYTPDWSFKTITPSEPTVTESTGTFQIGDGPEQSYSVTTESRTSMQVPQLGKPDKNGNYSNSGAGFVRTSSATTRAASTPLGNKTSAKSSSKDKTKKFDEEIDRYHEIKEVLEDINREQDRLGKAKDRAWGGTKLDLMDQEIAKTKEAIEAQKEYIRQIEQNIGADRGAIAAYGAQFDEYGRIINYDELIQSQVAKYNAGVASTVDSQVEAAEKSYENFKKALSNYEETADLLEQEYENLIDKQNEVYDKLLEKIEYTVEIKIEVSDRDKAYLDYLIGKTENNAYNTAEAISLIGEKTEKTLSNIETWRTGIEEIFGQHGKDGEFFEKWLNRELSDEELLDIGFTENEIKTLQDYTDSLLEANTELMEIKNTISEQILNAFNSFSDEIQSSADDLSHLNSVLSTYKNLIDLVGKQNLGINGKFMRELGQVAVNNATSSLIVSRDKLDTQKKMYDQMAQAAQEANDKYQEMLSNKDQYTESELKEMESVVKTFNDSLREMEQSVQSSEEEMLTSWETALQAAADTYQEAVTLALEEFENKMSAGFGSLDALLEVYNQSREVSTQYLAEYKQIYELSKLTRNINNSIDDIDNIKGKEKLRDLLLEIEEIQANGVQMSEYDLNYLQQRYDLRLAEIALEDAQNAKSQVQMTRDAEGNWNYTYVADDNAVDNARQNYEDKLYALQELSSQYIDEMENEWIQLQANQAKALAEIYQDTTLTEEERNLSIEKTTEYYTERLNYVGEELNKAIDNNHTLYNQDWTNYSNATGYKISSNEKFKDSFNETVLGTIYTGVNSLEELHNQFNIALGAPGQGGLLGDCFAAYEAWGVNIDEIMQATGSSVEDFKFDIEDMAKAVGDKSSEMANRVASAAEKMSEAFEDIGIEVNNWMQEYLKDIGSVISGNEDYINSLNELLKKLAEVTGASYEFNRISDRSNGFGNVPGINDGTSQVGSNGGKCTFTVTASPSSSKVKLSVGRTSEFTEGIGSNSVSVEPGTLVTYTVSCDGYQPITENVTVYNSKTINVLLQQNYSSTKNYRSPIGNPRDRSVLRFDTGGYTGEWGSSGRIAMLHQKELVLNPPDTKNMLQTIELVREITRNIDLNAVNASQGLGSLIAQTLHSNSQTLEQQVTIYAEFPNAVNHTEIEEAFNTLVNTASQYTNRKL